MKCSDCGKPIDPDDLDSVGDICGKCCDKLFTIVDTSKLESMVYGAIKSYGVQGCISDELRSKFFSGYPYSRITARYKALMEKGLIEDTGERRQGISGRSQRVMRAK